MKNWIIRFEFMESLVYNYNMLLLELYNIHVEK